MSEFIHKPEITLEMKRCFECGRYWAKEMAFQRNDPECPFCNGNRIEMGLDRINKLVHTVNALKSVITKLKKARQKS